MTIHKKIIQKMGEDSEDEFTAQFTVRDLESVCKTGKKLSLSI
jgi:hypothetical protein